MLLPAALCAIAVLGGCDKLPFLGPNRDAEGRAVGGACRHAGRALSDCYAYNPDLPKAAIFAGWRDMNDYMLDKKLDVVDPVLPAKVPKPPPSEGEAEGEGEHAAQPEKPTRRERRAAEARAAEARAAEARAAEGPSELAKAEPPADPHAAEAKPGAPRIADGKVVMPRAGERKAAPHGDTKAAPRGDAKAAPHGDAKAAPREAGKATEAHGETKPPPGGAIRPEPANVVAAAEPHKDKAKEKDAPDKKGEHH